MSRKKYIVIAILILTLLGISACSGGGVEPGEVTFDLSVIEIKGSTDGIEPPEVNPEGLSSGYRFTPPGEFDESNPNKWQVSTYLFSPSAMTANLGDLINLRMFVVNGDIHATKLLAPDGSEVENFVMNRGREYQISFDADQAGYYSLVCDNHGPTMEAKILVKP